MKEKHVSTIDLDNDRHICSNERKRMTRSRLRKEEETHAAVRSMKKKNTYTNTFFLWAFSSELLVRFIANGYE